MFFLFLQSFKIYLAIAWGTFAPGEKGLSWRRALVMVAFLPVFGLVQGLHWLGFLFDEIFFRGYRKVSVFQPLLVLGPPRSGTTLLHRVLAQDSQFTTFATWECLFAPSVTQRLFWSLGWQFAYGLSGCPYPLLYAGPPGPWRRSLLNSLPSVPVSSCSTAPMVARLYPNE
ncbi:sulfotransferase [Nitrosococcus wardiae]|uniref:sulfotransferase n=1 Tax=Nitrosococcus wardiae TaxID=1814290 RepID=UPI00141AFD7C|nr:sulfotransferase [Nitrosococcus wardiae]